MASFSFKGTVKSVGEVELYGSNFQKCTVVFEENDGNYTNIMAVEFINDRANVAVKKLTEGETYEVHCNVRSREHNGKYFTGLTGYKWNEVNGNSGY